MATLATGNTLSLNSLATATNQSSKTLGTCAGSTATPISMSAFAIDAVSSINGYTYVVESTAEDYSVVFSGSGDSHTGRFIKIAEQKKNYDWSISSSGTTYFTSASYDAAGAASGSITITAGDMTNAGSQTQLVGAQSHTLSVKFADGFNDHIGAGNKYNTAVSKTIYSVDSYDGNAAALCLISESPIIKADGNVVEVGDLNEGDELKGYALAGLSEDSDGDFLEWESDTIGETQKNVKVVNVTYSFSSKIYNINNGEIKGTSEHPMLIKDKSDGKYRFKELVRLEIGDYLIQEINNVLTEKEITSIEIETDEVEIVSLDVEVQDTYLVNGYVTHNKGGNSHTDLTAPDAPSSLAFNSGTDVLSWTAPSSTGTGGITAYDYQIDNNSGFDSTIASVTGHTSTSISSVSGISGIGTGTRYLRVRAYDQGLASDWSATLTFTISA